VKKSILITGVSGVGKTSLSQKLNEMGHKSYDIDDEQGLFRMIHKETGLPIKDHDNTNLEKVKVMSWICDKEKLASIIENEKSDLAFYCGNGSNIYQIMDLFKGVILLDVSLETIKNRLSTRVDNDYARTPDVQEYVLGKKDKWENEMKNKGAIIVDANGDLDSVAKEVIETAMRF